MPPPVPDVMTITGTSAKVAMRLCNFETGKSFLLGTHIAALDGKVMSVVQALKDPWVELIGHASRLGDEAKNEKFSKDRVEAVKARISQYSDRVNFQLEIFKGERESAGLGLKEDDNSGYYRSVEVLVGGSPFPPKPTPKPIPVPKEFEQIIKDLGEVLKKPPFSQFNIRMPSNMRRLTPEERKLVDPIFGNSLNYDRIFITDGNGGDGRAATIAVETGKKWIVTLNMGPGALEKSITGCDLNSNLCQHTLIHELVHAWQSQHSQSPNKYMAASASCQIKAAAMTTASQKASQLSSGVIPAREASAYAYLRGNPFGNYNVEAIAEMVANNETDIINIVKNTPAGPSAVNEASLVQENVEWTDPDPPVVAHKINRCVTI